MQVTRLSDLMNLPPRRVCLLEAVLLGHIEYVALIKGVLMAEKIIIFLNFKDAMRYSGMYRFLKPFR